MSSGWKPRPYVVGEENVYVVGMQGIVQAVTEETITIGGVVMPKRIDHARGVRYLSMLWPDADPCERKHCGPECDPEPAGDGTREDLETLTEMIRARHDETHSEGMRFCSDPICREVYDLDGAS